MLRISKFIDYGTLVLTQLAHCPDRLFSASDLSSTLGLGQPTVSKVLKMLAAHDLVRGVRGARGGYTLSRSADRISVADIVDALEDQPFGLTECTSTPGVCNLEAGCQIRVNWQRINDVVRRTLEDVSVADMMQPSPMHFPISGPVPSVRKGRGQSASPA